MDCGRIYVKVFPMNHLASAPTGDLIAKLTIRRYNCVTLGKLNLSLPRHRAFSSKRSLISRAITFALLSRPRTNYSHISRNKLATHFEYRQSRYTKRRDLTSFRLHQYFRLDQSASFFSPVGEIDEISFLTAIFPVSRNRAIFAYLPS